MAERLIKTIKHGMTVCLQPPTMPIAGMSNWQRLCLDIDAEFSLAQSSLLS